MFQKLILCYAYIIINVPLKTRFHPGESCMYPNLAIPPCNMVTTGKNRILAAFIIYTWDRAPEVRESHSLELSSCSHLFPDTRANRKRRHHCGIYRSVNNFRKIYKEGSRNLMNVLKDITDWSDVTVYHSWAVFSKLGNMEISLHTAQVFCFLLRLIGEMSRDTEFLTNLKGYP